MCQNRTRQLFKPALELVIIIRPNTHLTAAESDTVWPDDAESAPGVASASSVLRYVFGPTDKLDLRKDGLVRCLEVKRKSDISVLTGQAKVC